MPNDTSYLIEIPLEDKTNGNNILGTYFEMGLERNDSRRKLIQQVIM